MSGMTPSLKGLLSVENLKEKLERYPNLNVNKGALHDACGDGHVEVVEFLLAHPKINVNKKFSDEGIPPLLCGCWHEGVGVVKVLLDDPRVDVNLSDDSGNTPLLEGLRSLGVIKLMIASGRDFDWKNERRGEGEEEEEEREADEDYCIREAGRLGNPEVILLLERFKTNPSLVRSELVVELGLGREYAARLFAWVRFLCDGLLRIKPSSSMTDTSEIARFFSIAQQLPVKLQMILCHRAQLSSEDLISPAMIQKGLKFLLMSIRDRCVSFSSSFFFLSFFSLFFYFLLFRGLLEILNNNLLFQSEPSPYCCNKNKKPWACREPPF